jgi:DMSO reductase family type II enzyme heme b subunit
LGRVSHTLTDVDGPLVTQQSADRLVVQFATNPNEETERPYFLGGSTKRPVYVWRWTSQPMRVDEGSETGLGTFTAFPATRVTENARYVDGQWQVVFTRPFASNDTTQAPAFTTGHAIPMAFFAADGSNGEDDVRGSVSTWYAVYLAVPTPSRVFVAPIATIVLSAGLGMLLVARAQRRERGGGSDSGADDSHMEER